MADIPDYLYNPGSKQHGTAQIIVLEGIEDNKLIAERVEITPKTVSNVRSAIGKVANEMI